MKPFAGFTGRVKGVMGKINFPAFIRTTQFLRKELASNRQEYEKLRNQLNELEAESEDTLEELSKANDANAKWKSAYESLARQLEEQRQLLSTESRAHQEAQITARSAVDRAAHFESLYLAEVESHKASLKQHTNWFALSTSNRIPVHDGFGPTIPPPPPHQDYDTTGPLRASEAGRVNTNKVLNDLHTGMMAKVLDPDAPSMASPVPDFDPEAVVNSLWTQVAGEGVTPPWKEAAATAASAAAGA